MDATFWSTIALILFIVLIIYLKVPQMILDILDKRSREIQQNLDEAQNMREEAQQLLAEYQRKRKEAQEEAQAIVQAAESEAKSMLLDAEKKQEAYVKRRTLMVEQKIAQSETSAKAEIKAHAVDVAIEAAKNIINEKLDEKTSDEMFEENLKQIKSQLN